MKHITTLFIALLLAAAATAQISVVRFEEMPEDLAARTNPVEDDNGRKCALVKIETTLQGLVFEPDGLGICSTPDYKAGEVWLYLPPGASRITIKHPQAGVLRSYSYPIPIKAATTYLMQLRHATIETVIKEVQTENFLIIRPTPADAQVYVDGEYKGNGARQMRLRILDERTGQPIDHSYTVKAPLYHTASGTVQLNTADRTELNVSLEPAFGYLKVTTVPSDALLLLDDATDLGTSPLASRQLASGSYRIRAMKEMYQPVEQTVTISDGQTTDVKLTLPANFSHITFSVGRQAEIWVNGERRGSGRWEADLTAGFYHVETKLPGHRTQSKEIEARTGEPQRITLAEPTPIYGRLSIASDPIDAEIYIDGERVGTAPRILSEVLIGEHTVELRLNGYGRETRQARIEEGKEATVEVVMSAKLPTVATAEASGIECTSFVCGGSITDDGGAPITAKGVCWSTSPNPTIADSHTTDGTGSGAFRSALENLNPSTTYYVRAYATNRIGTCYGDEKTVSTTGKGSRTFTVNGVSFKMIYVKGGTFKMGCTNEQGEDCWDDESPSHRVTVGDYYIGETEVTQELWKAVMGSNPSYYKGGSKPVESVSWEDCQIFIRKLSQLTDSTFSLPTEAEWEFAARGGTQSRGYKYSGSDDIKDVAWYAANSKGTRPVKSKSPNELGIYDMSGNVLEWCSDWYDIYPGTLQTNPRGPDSGARRVSRGGNANSSAKYCRVSTRNNNSPTYRGTLGLRLALHD